MRSPRYILLLLLLSLLPRSAAGAEDYQAVTPLLGSADDAERDRAIESLKKGGFHSRDAVVKAMSSENERIRDGAKEVWKKVRWYPIPNAEAEIDAVMETWTAQAWTALARKHKAAAATILAQFHVETYLTAKERAIAASAILNHVRPLPLARVISQGKTQKIRQAYLDALKLHAEFNKSQTEELVEILIRLWRYEEAVSFACEMAPFDHSPDMIHHVAHAIRCGKLPVSTWTSAGKAESPQESFRLISFRLCIATKVGLEEQVHRFAAELAAFDPDAISIDELDELRKMSKYKDKPLPEVLAFLSRCKDPAKLWLLRQEYSYLRDLAKAEETEKSIEEALNALEGDKLESALYTLGTHSKDEDRKRFQFRILATLPHDSIYDVNALFALGSLAEADDEIEDAVRFFRKGLSIHHEGAFFIGGSGGTVMTKDDFLKHVDELEARIKKPADAASDEEPEKASP